MPAGVETYNARGALQYSSERGSGFTLIDSGSYGLIDNFGNQRKYDSAETWCEITYPAGCLMAWRVASGFTNMNLSLIHI